MTDLEQRARAFATHHHALVGQKRKYTGDPYIVHPASVAAIVKGVSHTVEMVAAAWLHDTVEDTLATFEEIENEFGIAVRELVEWLTDTSRSEDGNRAVRKAIDRARLARAPAAAQTVKLADLIDNTASILAHDPKFARIYLSEKAALLEVLTSGDRELWARANACAITPSR